MFKIFCAKTYARRGLHVYLCVHTRHSCHADVGKQVLGNFKQLWVIKSEVSSASVYKWGLPVAKSISALPCQLLGAKVPSGLWSRAEAWTKKAECPLTRAEAGALLPAGCVGPQLTQAEGLEGKRSLATANKICWISKQKLKILKELWRKTRELRCCNVKPYSNM